KILIIEDDLSVSESIKAWLEKENHVIDTVPDGKEGLDLLLHYAYDLAIIDWQLPGMEGVDICLALQKANKKVPALMLTSRASVDDRVSGLEAGAFDYLVKPCSLEELSARLRALLRRHPVSQEKSLIVGDLELKSDSHEVLRNGEKLALSPIEFEVFKLLARNQDTSFSADAMLARLWADKPQVSKQLVKVHVKNLRKKLASVGTNVSIATSKNEGYTLSIGELASDLEES
ncbi:MAG: response regulator transcription factor, partial [Candidatus Obscuribacterales bacterium]|nr:response regulator transcription factor [Candidatus Obscuribacterales bacterium]